MKAILVAQDAGGADSLLQLALARPDQFTCLMTGKAKDVFSKAGIPCSEPQDVSKDINGADIIVTGTSFGLSLDKKAILAVKDKGIPTISIVDYWSNYWERFKDPETGDKILPDVICVIDPLMKTEMTSEGFPDKILKVTGNPSFDAYAPADKTLERDNVLFVSQPLSELDDDYGYDEMIALKDVVETLSQINQEGKERLTLTIRPHPREYESKFEGMTKHDIDIKIDKDTPIETLITQSRIIIGMTSIVLFRAALAGKHVISYQPGVKKDISILEKLDIIRTTKDTETLKKKIREGYAQVPDNIIRSYTRAGATEKCLKIIDDLAGRYRESAEKKTG